MRCPVCEHENVKSATRCEACDHPLGDYDQPQSIERYRRAFEKLITDGALSDRAAKQCQKLRAKLNISEEFHDHLLSAYSAPPPEESALILALSWSGDPKIELAILHQGDFTFERVEVTLFSTHTQKLLRRDRVDLDPDDHWIFTADLVELSASERESSSSDAEVASSTLAGLGVQLQIRAVDITEEIVSYRSLFLSISGGEDELIGLDGVKATALHELTERRTLQRLLGSGAWLPVQLQTINEDEYFQWEVGVSAAREWRKRSADGGWRVGDQLNTEFAGAILSERLCPSGVSWMGAPLGVGRDWETPAHQIRLNHPLWCTETPITQTLWIEIMGENPSASPADSHPVNSVSWYDAISFCNRLSRRSSLSPVYHIDSERNEVTRDHRASGYRLPTEAEWEHLARAGLDRFYAGSNQHESVCWSLEDGEDMSQPVAGKGSNAWGLYDFCGNVWEWCEDLFYEHIYRERIGITSNPQVWEPQLRGATLNEALPPEKLHRVRRGGSWATPAKSCRVFTRADGAPRWRSHCVGLRVVRAERGGIRPADRSVDPTSATWAHLHSGQIYLGCVTSSPRRAWALRLESLGLSITLEEEHADVVVVIPPKKPRPEPQLESTLNALRRRARGVGALVLEIDQLNPIIESREREVHALERQESRWDQLQDKRVMMVGRFRSTQRILRERLTARGVHFTPKLDQADVLIAGGGQRAEHQRRLMSARAGLVFNEVECLALLDAPYILPVDAAPDA